jgi:hypothetical protein
MPIVKAKYSDNFSIKITNLQELLEFYNLINIDNSISQAAEIKNIPAQQKSILKKKNNLKVPHSGNMLIHTNTIETPVMKHSKSSKKSKNLLNCRSQHMQELSSQYY